MKTLILTTALVVITTLTIAQTEKTGENNPLALNQQEISAVIYPTTNEMVTMLIEKEPGVVVSLKVKEEDGNVIYRKKIKKDNLSRTRFDISQFPSGLYTFELVKKNETIYSKVIDKQESAIAVVQ